jgi:serine protease Do
MPGLAPKSAVAGLIAAVLLGIMGAAVTAQTGHDVVHCYDESLGTVRQTLASDCRGRIVTEGEAAAIRDQRRNYIRNVLAKPADDRIRGKRLAGLGSGFFVDEDGTVLTNHHVVEGCTVVSVTPTFGDMGLAKAVIPDEQADLALLRTDLKPPGLPAFAQGSGAAVLGPGFIAGYPEQGLATITPILTSVEVLYRESRTTGGPVIVVRGDVRRGNSGGPLLDSGGSVVGVVTAKVDTVNVYNATGETVRDVGLVLPGDRVQDFLDGQGVRYRREQRRPLQSADRMLDDARAFMAQIGCWR